MSKEKELLKKSKLSLELLKNNNLSSNDLKKINNTPKELLKHSKKSGGDLLKLLLAIPVLVSAYYIKKFLFKKENKKEQVIFDTIEVKSNFEIDSKKEKNSFIDKFQIKNSNIPIYKNLKKISDIDDRINDIIKEIEKIKLEEFHIEKITDENTKKALNAINRIIDKYITKIEKMEELKGSDEIINISDIEELFKEKLIKNSDKFFIQKIIDSLYKGLESEIEYQLYESLLKSVNRYLSFLGCKTYNIELNKEVDLDYVDILTVKETDIDKLVGKVAKIIRYPYIFDEENILSEGSIIVYKKGEIE